MDISKTTVTLIKRELSQRDLSTHGLKGQGALVERLTEAMERKNSNEAFHSCTKQINRDCQCREGRPNPRRRPRS